MKYFATLIIFLSLLITLTSQDLPLEVNITPEGRLTYGGNKTEGFYSLDVVNKLEITLTQEDWFTRLDGEGRGPNQTAGESLIGTLTFNDSLVLDSVLVSIKGQTSDSRNNSEKKSFKIEIDEIVDQDLEGYDNLNLNCAFQDHSSMREVLYYDITRSFAPALKGNFVDLYINGQYWGPYNNIQQIEGRYIGEWFANNDGTRWRATPPDGTTGGQGPNNRFGQGLSTLNYNGPDSTDYNRNYTLKKSGKDSPWEDLIGACYNLNSLPIDDLYDSLKYTLDIDRALWFLVQEIVFADDDSYINKGGMDYYVYWDEATGRIIPMEVDGNSVLTGNHVLWSPFYNEDDADFPLLNRLLQNTEIRQRYLAHLRTVLEQHFTISKVHSRIDEFALILDQKIQDDPKKIYTYNQFIADIEHLKNMVTVRINNLKSNTEVDRVGVSISEVTMESSEGKGIAPKQSEEVKVYAKIESEAKKLVLYFGLGTDGVFERNEMYDDGTNGDEVAGDNTYTGTIPGFSSGSYVRYYIEAIKNDEFATASYYPPGAEHDVFIYRVEPTVAEYNGVVINEFAADNKAAVTDNAGEYDDWIELYNNSVDEVDLSGYYMTDDGTELTKWQFPEGTTIEAAGYLIVWADEDEDQVSEDELHSDFKLSSGGEEILLLNPDLEIVDTVTFDEQNADITFARVPNGTGDFRFNMPTFMSNNEGGTTSISSGLEDSSFLIYPNPVSHTLNIESSDISSELLKLAIINATGKIVLEKNISSNYTLQTENLVSGVYNLIIKNIDGKTVLNRKIVVLR